MYVGRGWQVIVNQVGIYICKVAALPAADATVSIDAELRDLLEAYACSGHDVYDVGGLYIRFIRAKNEYDASIVNNSTLTVEMISSIPSTPICSIIITVPSSSSHATHLWAYGFAKSGENSFIVSQPQAMPAHGVLVPESIVFDNDRVRSRIETVRVGTYFVDRSCGRISYTDGSEEATSLANDIMEEFISTTKSSIRTVLL